MLVDVRRVFVIQNKVTGAFLSPSLFWVTSLKRAGRLYDAQEAFDTADANSDCDDYEISSFYEAIS